MTGQHVTAVPVGGPEVRRTLYGPEHEAFRDMVRAFIAREVVPAYPDWLENGAPPWELFQRLGDLGVMGMNMPAEFGGSDQDFVSTRSCRRRRGAPPSCSGRCARTWTWCCRISAVMPARSSGSGGSPGSVPGS